MKSKKKSLLVLLVITIMFAATMAFVSVNYKRAAAEPEGDVEFEISMVDGEGVDIDGGSVFDKNGQQVGPGKLYKNFEESVQFTAEARYYNLTGYTIEWEGGGVSINGITEESSSSPVQGSSETLEIAVSYIENAAEKIIINFIFEAKEYNIFGTARHIKNFAVSDCGGNIAGITVSLINTEVNPEKAGIQFKVGDTVNITADNQTTASFFDYAFLNIIDGEYDYFHDIFNLENNHIENRQLTLTAEFLDSYLLVTDEIIVTGAFMETYSVKILDYTDEMFSGQNFIEITVYEHLTDQTTVFKDAPSIEQFREAVDLSEGSYIKVTAKNVAYFNSGELTVKKGGGIVEIDNPAEYMIEYLDADYEIEAQFQRTEYTLNISGMDSFNDPVNLNGSIRINGEETDTFKFLYGDVITLELSEDLKITEDFDDHFFAVKLNSTSLGMKQLTNELVYEFKADDEFLNGYLNLNSKNLTFVIGFINSYMFSIDFNLTDGGQGFYEISINDGLPESLTDGYSAELNYGTKITLVLKPEQYTSIEWGGIYNGEKQDNIITVIINNANRNIWISYAPFKFSLKDNTVREGYSTTSLIDLELGSRIKFYIGTADSDEIKSWTINGINVLEKLPSGASYSKGTLTIDVNEYWLNEVFKNYEFENKITTGMRKDLLITIIIPSATIPLLTVILLAILITNSKRKKFIKAELLNEKMQGYTYSSGTMIADLREDKFMKVSKKEIKEEMKKKKQEARARQKEEWLRKTDDRED